MEVMIAVAIGTLAVVFVSALITLLILLCYRCKEEDLISQQHQKDSRPDAQLIEDEGPEPAEVGVELGTVQIASPRLEEVLNEGPFLDDKSGLVSHCMSILKSCHRLLAGMTEENANVILTQEAVTEINVAAKRINPHLDEVVHCMNTSVNPRLLETRFTALVQSVSHLVMITKKVCQMSGALDWIDQTLADIEDHMKVLREVSMNLSGLAQSSITTVEHHAQPQNGPMLGNDNSEV